MTGALRGKVAIVTGGSRGIGRAVATAFAAEGAHVFLVARNGEDLTLAAKAIGGDVGWCAGSVRDPDVAGRAVEQACSMFGSVDILVNNAAINPYFGPLMGISWRQMAASSEANQAAVVTWTQQCWTRWMRDHGGSVINMTSVGAFNPEPGIGYYNATKAAVLQLTRQMAVELGPAVRVNAIAPGVVRTEMARALWEAQESDLRISTPLRRIGETDDIAGAAVYFASDASKWTTGAMLVVDGGMSLV